MSKDTIYRQDAIEAVDNACRDWRGTFRRCEDALKALPSANPDVITMRVDIDEKQFEKAWKQALASSPLTVFPDEELDTGLYVDGFDDGFKAGTQRWIPVTERLPEEDGTYIVCLDDGSVFEYDYISKWWDDGAWQYCGKDVVAWMPFPEPYKEKKNE